MKKQKKKNNGKHLKAGPSYQLKYISSISSAFFLGRASSNIYPARRPRHTTSNVRPLFFQGNTHTSGTK